MTGAPHHLQLEPLAGQVSARPGRTHLSPALLFRAQQPHLVAPQSLVWARVLTESCGPGLVRWDMGLGGAMRRVNLLWWPADAPE